MHECHASDLQGITAFLIFVGAIVVLLIVIFLGDWLYSTVRRGHKVPNYKAHRPSELFRDQWKS